MDMNTEVVNTPPLAAATVVLVRDAAGGMETFLVQRHGASQVLAGAHVFPGGKVDGSDLLPGCLDLLAHPMHDLPARLNEPEITAKIAASIYVAAIRETFEESGVLLAHGAGAEHVLRAAELVLQGLTFGAALAKLGLRLDAGALVPWSRWITPRVPTVTNRRFDTRFFVATLPPGQRAWHDDIETTASEWLRPGDALRRYWDGSIALAPPQIMTLAHLSHYASVADALHSSRSRLPALIEPEPFDIDGERTVCYPGDARHRHGVRAMPGPTRLVFRNRRFEPPEGFDALFADPPTR